jgi:hypothetical protein
MLASKQLILAVVSIAEDGTKTSQLVLGEAPPADRRRLIFGIVSIGLFMASIDQTNVLVPQHVFAG